MCTLCWFDKPRYCETFFIIRLVNTPFTLHNYRFVVDVDVRILKRFQQLSGT